MDGFRPARPAEDFFASLEPLAIGSPHDLAAVALSHRLRFAVPVRQPLALISQIQRSGGSLLSQLLDGHPELHVHPGELHIGRPNKYHWPVIGLQSSPAEMFERLVEKDAWRYTQFGYEKHSSPRQGKGSHPDKVLPFLFSPTVQSALFERQLRSGANSSRHVLDAYATSYFNAWLDYQGLYREPASLRYWVGFAARLAGQPAEMAAMFEDYPDGRLIVSLRRPADWLASARLHSDEYADADQALDLWVRTAQGIYETVSARPAVVHVLRFEKLVTETEAVMRGVARFLGIRFDSSLLRPTFNGIPVLSNSSFEPVAGIDRRPADRSRDLGGVTLQDISERTDPIYRKLAAIAHYHERRS